MEKRLIRRKGDFFCTEVNSAYKIYLQYIAVDKSQLGSMVVRVFKKHYSMDESVDFDEVAMGEVWFYAHVYGLGKMCCYKCGKSKILGDTENIMFRTPYEVDFSKIDISYRWFVWKINQERVYVGKLNDTYRKYDMGGVFPITWVYEKILTGKFPCKEIKG